MVQCIGRPTVAASEKECKENCQLAVDGMCESDCKKSPNQCKQCKDLANWSSCYKTCLKGPKGKPRWWCMDRVTWLDRHTSFRPANVFSFFILLFISLFIYLWRWWPTNRKLIYMQGCFFCYIFYQTRLVLFKLYRCLHRTENARRSPPKHALSDLADIRQ